MAFELRANERLSKSLRKAVAKQLRRVESAFCEKSSDQSDGAVHDARKRLKRVRAVVRLVGPEIGSKRFSRENRAMRDVGRPLSEIRDAKVLIETLDKLLSSREDAAAATSFDVVNRALHADLERVRRQLLEQDHTFKRLGRDVRRMQQRVEDWTDVANRWPSMGAGLEKTYAAARGAMELAAEDRNVESFHEWRKQTKYLRHQLEFLRPCWEQRIPDLAGDAERLGKMLGDDHDLAVLEARLRRGTCEGDESPRIDDLEAVAFVSKAIASRRAQLEEEVLTAGRHYFSEPAGEFVRKLKADWKAWRKENARAKAELEPPAVAVVGIS